MAEVAQAASTHRQHQVVCRCGCRLTVMFTCHNVQTPAIEPVYRSITVRLRVQASQQCGRLPKYSKLGTFSSGGSLPMTTLSRYASAAHLLLDLTALSVKEPMHDRYVRPPSHQRAMCIFRPRSLVNSRVHDSHLCTRFSFAMSASVVALVRVVLWMCIILLFLVEMIN